MKRFAAVSLVVIGTVSLNAQAGVISLTGQELLSQSNVTFPTDTPAAVGASSIEFTDDTRPNNAILFDWNLFSAGAITGAGTVTVSANFTQRTNDQDLVFGLTDSNNHAFAGAQDAGFLSWVGEGSLFASDTRWNQSANQFGPSAGASLSPSFTIEAVFALDLTGILSVTSTVSRGAFSSTTTYNPTGSIDTTGPLSIFFGGDTRDEDYQLNTIEVDSEFLVMSVPEPATIALIALGIVGIGFQRRKELKA